MEIEHQCKFTINSYHELVRSLQDDYAKYSNIGEFNFRIWASIQSIVTACANISKILSPPSPQDKDKSLKKEIEERGEYLKRKLSVSNESLLLSGDVRNHFEHFDERLHKWARESRILVLRNIGPSESIHITSDNISSKLYMANFDQNTYILTFWEHEFSIHDMISQVKTLLERTQTELRKFNGFRF
jgi:hypothetical protein